MTSNREWMKAHLAWAQVPILGGPLKGNRFGLFTGPSLVAGSHQREEASVFIRQLKPGDVVFEVGARVGYFTLLASRTVHTSGKVVAFEPSPLNLKYLQRHIQSNNLQNVQLIDSAVGRSEGWVTSELGRRMDTGHLDFQASHEQRVRVCRLDTLHRTHRLPTPTLIKVDVEGAELDILAGAAELLWQHHPKILLANASGEQRSACEKFLSSFGYVFDAAAQAMLICSAPKKRLAAAA